MFPLVPYQGCYNPWAWSEGNFSEEQLNVLEAEAALADEEAKTGNGDEGSGVNKNLRRSKIRWIHPHNNQFNWFFNRLADAISRMNADYFRLDLTGFGEPAQFTRYEAKVRGEYDWHQDHGALGASRKLSVTVQLTDPEKYVGGDFEFLLGHDDIQRPVRKRGLIVAFPSYQMHRVTPVRKGVRHSAVIWVSGPAFR